jgi:hypothetical protein
VFHSGPFLFLPRSNLLRTARIRQNPPKKSKRKGRVSLFLGRSKQRLPTCSVENHRFGCSRSPKIREIPMT